MGRRFHANRAALPRWLNLVRGVSSEGFGRLKQFRNLRRRLDTDEDLCAFLAGESDRIPTHYTEILRKDLGTLWKWLPDGAMQHNPQAYLDASRHGTVAVPTSVAEAIPLKSVAEAGS
jgi:hypothetical protein